MYCTTVRSIKRPSHNPIPPLMTLVEPALAHRSAYFMEPFIHEKNSSLSDLAFSVLFLLLSPCFRRGRCLNYGWSK
jgi:hypothetical protein